MRRKPLLYILGRSLDPCRPDADTFQCHVKLQLELFSVFVLSCASIKSNVQCPFLGEAHLEKHHDVLIILVRREVVECIL